MTVTSKAVKKRIVVRSKNTHPKYTPPNLPNNPLVTTGPKSYGRTRKGNYIIIRFYIYKKRRSNIWFVMDSDEAGIAEGTKLEGYENKEEAIKIAREYRNSYGAWSQCPF